MTFTAKRMKPLSLKTAKILRLPVLSDSSPAFYSQPICISRVGHFKWPYLSKVALLLALVSLLLAGCGGSTPYSSQPKDVRVTIPGSDYFSPAIITIHVGDTVRWTNQDTDDHTITSAPRSAGTTVSDGFDSRIPGTNANHGEAGTFSHTFKTAGTLVYYCKIHAKLDPTIHQFAPKMATDPPLPAMMGSIAILP